MEVKVPTWCTQIRFYCRRCNSSTCFGRMRPSSGAIRFRQAAYFILRCLQLRGGVRSRCASRMCAKGVTAESNSDTLSTHMARTTAPHATSQLQATWNTICCLSKPYRSWRCAHTPETCRIVASSKIKSYLFASIWYFYFQKELHNSFEVFYGCVTSNFRLPIF
jgi:hypothetical protein